MPDCLAARSRDCEGSGLRLDSSAAAALRPAIRSYAQGGRSDPPGVTNPRSQAQERGQGDAAEEDQLEGLLIMG